MLDLKAAIVAVRLHGLIPLGKRTEEEVCWYSNPAIRNIGTCRGPLAVYTDSNQYNYVIVCAKHTSFISGWQLYE